MLPVDIGGWLLRRVSIPENTVPWTLVVTADPSVQLAIHMLVRGPRPMSVLCGLSDVKYDATTKEQLDRVIADTAIPGARGLDGLMEVKWSQVTAGATVMIRHARTPGWVSVHNEKLLYSVQ